LNRLRKIKKELAGVCGGVWEKKKGKRWELAVGESPDERGFISLKGKSKKKRPLKSSSIRGGPWKKKEESSKKDCPERGGALNKKIEKKGRKKGGMFHFGKGIRPKQSTLPEEILSDRKGLPQGKRRQSF